MTLKGTHALGIFAGIVALALGLRAWHAMTPPAEAMTPVCSASDFLLRDVRLSRHYERATVAGTITSSCAHAAVVRLRWVVRNGDGTTSSFPFYAHDGVPVQPGESYSFGVTADAPVSCAKWVKASGGTTIGTDCRTDSRVVVDAALPA